jgi:hypothetical protein
MIENADAAVCITEGNKISPSSFNRTGARADLSSLESSAGIQYWRVNAPPIGVPGPFVA